MTLEQQTTNNRIFHQVKTSHTIFFHALQNKSILGVLTLQRTKEWAHMEIQHRLLLSQYRPLLHSKYHVLFTTLQHHQTLAIDINQRAH